MGTGEISRSIHATHKKQKQNFKMKFQLAYASLQAISLASGRHYRSGPLPEYMKDLYDHKNVDGWNSVYDVYQTPEWDTQSVSGMENPVESLEEILEDDSYVVLDLRTDQEVEDASWDFADMKVEASYGRFVYDDVKTDPSLLIRTVGELTGLEVDEDSLPTNTNEDIRDKPLLLLCGGQYCGCRFAFAKWHGFRNVQTYQNLNGAFDDN